MKSDRNALVWGGLLILLGFGFLLETLAVIHFMGQFIWAVALIGISLPFWLIYLTEQEQWWALFPSCILAGIGAGVLVGGALAAIIITASISLPFWLIYLKDRRNWWALIPGWTMICVSAIVLLGLIRMDWFIAPFVMFAIATPFLLVYILHRDQWWALIPGGVMTTIGFALLLSEIVTTLAFWPVFLILAGVWLVYRAVKPQRAASLPTSQYEELDPPASSAQPDQPR